MKKLTAMILSLLCITLLLTACDTGRTQPVTPADDEEFSFQAKVLTIGDDHVLVEALEGEGVRSSSDQFSISTADLDDIGIEVGDTVDIVCQGYIQETYPAGVTAVNWSIVDKGDDFQALTAPPLLIITYETITAEIDRFPPTTWTYHVPDSDEMTTYIADGFHPLYAQEIFARFPWTGMDSIRLWAQGEPVFEAKAWPEALLNLDEEERMAREEATPLTIEDDTLLLPDADSGYLIEVTATWADQEDGASPFGSTSYLFLITTN